MAREYNQHARYIEHSVWDHWPRPNATIIRATMDPARYPKLITYTTNSCGCRYLRELTIPKPANIVRILVLGDSFTEGYYYEDTVAARLERRLNDSYNGSNFEVVNCGSSSYSPLLHYLRLKHQLIVGLEPDWLILNLDLTDIFDDYWRYRPQSIFVSSGEPIAARGSVGWLTRVKEWLKYKFYLMRFLAGVRYSLSSNLTSAQNALSQGAPTLDNIFAYYSTLPAESDDWKREVDFILANITRIIKFSKEHGISMAVTMYPHRQQLEPDVNGRLWHREFEHRVEKLCHDLGVNFYSAYDGIARAFYRGQPVFWDNNMHFTPEGQRIWANLITEYFLDLLRSRTAHVD